MSDDFLKSQIMSYLHRRAKGKENAVPRDEVLKELQLFDPKLSDRKFRDLYSRLPICSCAAGLFIPRDPGEAFEFFRYLEKQIGPIHATARYRILLSYYPELSRKVGEQRELFP